MSAIASFIKLPKTSLAGLQDAAVSDIFDEYLEEQGQEVAEYLPSGYILATLLVYLKERHQIDLMNSEFKELSGFLCKTQEATIFFFTGEQREAYSGRLAGEFPVQEMGDYYNEFNGANEAGIGEAMLEGIQAFRQSLDAVDKDSVIFFKIG